MANNSLTSSQIRPLTQSDIPAIVRAFAAVGWHKPTSTFENYFLEQEKKQRDIWLAFQNDTIAGYTTLKWHSSYPSFKEQNIPEINDFNVLPQFRRQGIGSKLLDIAEEKTRLVNKRVGIGVGLYNDYGSAQRLYVKRGYMPDGRGITYQYQPVVPGHLVCLDDDLILWFVKSFD
ncbi:MAG: GNAT family N-acetyltransferase [Alphaproteobacteria bacterium]|nr:GNAT family N-acetyltransferase [Alphaproteobacteria bacterium]